MKAADAVLAPDAGEPPQTAEWNEYYQYRWLAGRDPADLAELIRRAKHRDGSTQSIVTSSNAMELLSELERDPPTAEALTVLGWSSSAVTFGYHPPGQPVPFTRTAALGSIPPGGAVSVMMPSGQVVAQAAGPAPAAAPAVLPSDVLAKADLMGVRVTLGGTYLSITAAIRLGDSITAAVRSLLLPGEGYVWIDLTADPRRSSSLAVLDGELAAGLPAFPDSPGTALKGEVLQDELSGNYTGRVYSGDGSVRTVPGIFSDMNEAKAAVAEVVRG